MNLPERGLDFAALDEAFSLEAVVVPAKHDRWMAIGWHGDAALSVVFSPLGSEGLSVVSMRPASRKERRLL